MNATDTIIQKTELFMTSCILPFFDPEELLWVFSLSGGKDSFTMCTGVRLWYESRGKQLNAQGVYIWQWGDSLRNKLSESLPWLEIKEIDARRETGEMTEKACVLTKQAPCRSCADIRREKTDVFLSELCSEKPILLCRGLHLSDVAISILWRFLWYGHDGMIAGKGRPFVRLAQNVYLTKPLCFVREYESQVFAAGQGYQALQCQCPALRYPSRRDIVEESARCFYRGALWEFDIPGTNEYLSSILPDHGDESVRRLSLPGIESKKPYIPEAYYDFAADYFYGKCKIGRGETGKPLLEARIGAFLSDGKRCAAADPGWTCKLLAAPEALNSFDRRMIGTLGPFWAAIALPDGMKEATFARQAALFGFSPDIKWSQVIALLCQYYRE